MKKRRKKKKDSPKTHLRAFYKRLTSDVRTYRMKVKGWTKLFQSNGNGKNAGVAVLIPDK